MSGGGSREARAGEPVRFRPADAAGSPGWADRVVRLAAWALVLGCLATAGCGRGADGEAGEGSHPAVRDEAGAEAAARGDEAGGEAGGEADGDAGDLPPQIVAEHPVPSPGAPGGRRPGDAVSFVDEGGAEPAGPGAEIHLAVADLAASSAFYADVLGFTVEAASPAEPPHRRIELARDGVRLVLRRRDELAAELPRPASEAAGAGEEDAGVAADAAEAGVASGEGDEAEETTPPSAAAPAAFHLPAADLDALLRRVEEAAAGTARLGETAGGARRLAVRDPDGHVLAFVEALPPEPPD